MAADPTEHRGATVLADSVSRARLDGKSALDEAAGKAVLAAFGVAVPRCHLVRDADEATARAGQLQAPYVLKVSSADILHKSDVGGVKLGLATPEDVARALEVMRAALAHQGAHPTHWLLEETAPSGLEFVVGGVDDPEFGPMVMAGLGGVFVEVMGDVAFRICPIDRGDAIEMLDELKGAAILRGARGRSRVDIEAIIDVLLKIAGEGGLLMRCGKDVAEIDINPLIVGEAGAVAVDARFILRA